MPVGGRHGRRRRESRQSLGDPRAYRLDPAALRRAAPQSAPPPARGRFGQGHTRRHWTPPAKVGGTAAGRWGMPVPRRPKRPAWGTVGGPPAAGCGDRRPGKLGKPGAPAEGRGHSGRAMRARRPRWVVSPACVPVRRARGWVGTGGGRSRAGHRSPIPRACAAGRARPGPPAECAGDHHATDRGKITTVSASRRAARTRSARCCSARSRANRPHTVSADPSRRTCAPCERTRQASSVRPIR